jgi:hypothetical protein
MIITKPIFRIFDYDKAVVHYVDWLGFKIDWQHQLEPNSPYYMQVSLGDLVLHLSEHSGDCSPGAHIYIDNFVGLKEYHKKLIDKKYRYNRPGIGKSYWVEGVTTMEVIDPFRNIITFNENKEYVEDAVE